MAASRIGIAVVSCVLWPALAVAQPGGSVNCGAASGLAEAMICSDPNLGESDGRLAERFDTAITKLEAQGEEGEEAVAELREGQEEFVTARDACRSSTNTRDCVAQAYALREAELIATYELEEPASSTTYVCSGSGDATISIALYDLETPTVRIQTGADVAAGTGVPTANSRFASKYALNTGQEVFLHREVARFTGADGRTQTCVKEDS